MKKKPITANSPPESHSSLGAELMKARQLLGWSLDQLSQNTCLSKKILMDLEHDNYENLPSTPYVKAFLVTLSKHLNLDSATIISRFHQTSGIAPNSISSATSLNGTVPLNKQNRLTPVFITAFVLCILVVVLSPLKNSFLKMSAGSDTGIHSFDQSKSGMSPPIIGQTKQAANLLAFEGLSDTVWIEVKQKNRPDTSKLLLRGKMWKIAYNDTIRIHSGVLGGIRLYIEGKSLVPNKRLFMVHRGKLIQ